MDFKKFLPFGPTRDSITKDRTKAIYIISQVIALFDPPNRVSLFLMIQPFAGPRDDLFVIEIWAHSLPTLNKKSIKRD